MANHSQYSYNRTPVLTVCQKHIPGQFLVLVDSVEITFNTTNQLLLSVRSHVETRNIEACEKQFRLCKINVNH